MKSKLLFTLCAMLLFGFMLNVANAQQMRLDSLTNELSNNIKTVQTGKNTSEQKIESPQSCVLKYSVSNIDTKGKTTDFVYEFNMADIDPNIVQQKTSGDMIYVQVVMDKNQKMIKVTKDGELEPYIDDLKIIAEDIDNARMLKDIIKSAILIAEKIMKEKLNLPTYSDQLNWLTENVGNVDAGNTAYQQSMKEDADKIGKVIFNTIKISGKSNVDSRFEFNLADINPNSVMFEISGNLFSVVFETKQRQKIIKEYKDNTQQSFTQKVEIVTNNVEEARDLLNVLKQIIPNAEKLISESLPEVEDANQAMSLLSDNVKEVVIDNTTYQQSFTDNCVTQFTSIENDPKSSTQMVYDFNMSDINENTIDYKITGKKMFVVCDTKAGNKLIKTFKNDELQNYSNDIEIVCSDIEDARKIKYLLQKAVPLCENSIERLVPENNLADKLSWLCQNITEVSDGDDTYVQTLEKISDDNNKVKLTIVKTSKQKSTEDIFEFNLSDINPRSVEFHVVGKELSIRMNTNYKAKVIKAYQDGKIQKYANEITIRANSIELARNFITAFTECIEENKK